MMKRDGRELDHRTLEALRLMAVERVRDGEAPSSVIASYGFCRTTIYKWIAAASKPGVGLRALRSRLATGRPRSLTPRQEQQVFRWVNGKDPSPVRPGFRPLDTIYRCRADRTQIQYRAGSDGGGRIACQARSDAAKAAATGVSARSGSD